MYAIEDIATPYKDIVLTEKYNDKEAIKDVLHIDAYKDYTNKYLVKKFYKSLLIEQYMFEENYSLLGRSYARQVNYIALPTNSDYPGAAKNLLVAFADQYLEQDYTFTDAKVDYSLIEMKYDDAINLYGSDKPDLRFDMKINDITDIFKNTINIEDTSGNEVMIRKSDSTGYWTSYNPAVRKTYLSKAVLCDFVYDTYENAFGHKWEEQFPVTTFLDVYEKNTEEIIKAALKLL